MRERLYIYALVAALAMLAPHFADAASLSKAPNNLGLVGYWSFDDATSTKASDLSGRGTTGTLTNFALSGATSNWVAGKRGGALHFDGINDYVDLGSKTLGYGNLTVSAWIKVGGGACGSQYVGIVSKNYYSDFVFAYTCSGADTGKVVAYVTNTVAAGSGNLFSNVLVNDGSWHHVAITSNGTNVRMYVDGAYQNQAALSGNVRDSVAAISIGSYTGGLQFFGGSIDDVRIYSRALSDAEMAAMYRSGSVKYKAPSNLGLVAYWSFNDGGGSRAGDGSGYGRALALSNINSATDWVQGKRGGGLNFNGSGAYGSSSVPLTGSAATITAWIKADGFQSDFPYISSIGGIEAGDTNAFLLRFGDATLANDKLQFVVGPDTKLDGNTSLQVGAWYHVAATWSGSAMRIYVNGSLDSSGNGGPASIAPSQPFYVSKYYATNERYFDGVIDDMRVYNRALTAAEIAAMYRSGETKINSSQNDKLTNGLIGLWSFNGQDVIGTTAYDRSGQGKHGTLTNGPTPTIGKLGQGLLFDGSNDEVTISDAFDPTAYTISAWVKFTSSAAQNIFTRTDSTGPTSSWSHQLRLDSAGKFQHYAYDGGAKTVTGSTAIQPNTWYHVVGTAADGGNMELFVNGVSQGTTPVTTLWIGGDRYVIGSSSGSAGEARGFLGGSVDDVRLYNRVLTTAEIRQLYSMGR